MFSKELENLIEATLADGVLTDQEKVALMKRAQSEGADLVELEIYINSIMQKRQQEKAAKEEAKQEKIDQKKKEALGRICPNCGATVPPLTMKCACGYVFSNGGNVSSVQLLSEKIEKLTLSESKDASNDEKKGIDEKIVQVISTYPVPNTKEDIVEFLAMAVSFGKKKGGFCATAKSRLIVCLIAGIPLLPVYGLGLFLMILGILSYGESYTTADRWNIKAAAWRAKFEQVMVKARSMRGDAEFQQQLDYYENLFKKK